MAATFTLGKNERLKSRKLIEQLFKEGKSFNLFPYKVIYSFTELGADNKESKLKFGVAVSSKNFKKAVDRNRVKRLTREAYRIQKNELRGLLQGQYKQMNVFYIYTAKEIPVFENIKEKLNLILNKLLTIVNEKNSSTT